MGNVMLLLKSQDGGTWNMLNSSETRKIDQILEDNRLLDSESKNGILVQAKSFHKGEIMFGALATTN